jgi:hypothetical protein
MLVQVTLARLTQLQLYESFSIKARMFGAG